MQVEDDVDLLNLMIRDHEEAPGEYKATARWAEYSERFVSFLRETGLHDFRRTRAEKGSPGAVLGSFGAVDLNPSAGRISAEDMFHAAASSFKGAGAVDIRALPSSKVGNPEGFEVEQRFYTLSWLNYYCRYAFVTKQMNFEKQFIVEVGPGSGKQAEMLKKAHPGLTIVLFDLPTQLYVCNQYLSKVFAGTDQVVGYRAGRLLQNFEGVVPGKINILPHWKFPLVKSRSFDLLWNAASFQEMDPVTAKQYLDLASSARSMFLMYNIKYRPNAPYPGARGVVSPKILANFDEVDRATARLALMPETWLYHDSFWRRRGHLT